jgi:hypothetical protein
MTAEDHDPLRTPLVLLEDEYGGKARIVMDDHCYVLQLHRVAPSRWISVTHWFREAAEALRDILMADAAVPR